MSASLIGRLGQALSDHPPLQCRCLTRARASLRNRHQGPCMGLFCQGDLAGRPFFFASFFVRSEGRFFVPIRTSLESARTGAVKVGRRANLAAYSTLHRPHLDSFEHDATAWCGSDDDDQRGARLRARINRATTLYSVGPRTRTMMQSCASAAKLRSGGPILPFGMKAKGPLGIPPPRTVIGVPSQAYGQGRNCRGTFSVLRSLCYTQNDAVRDNALPHEPPQGDQ